MKSEKMKIVGGRQKQSRSGKSIRKPQNPAELLPAGYLKGKEADAKFAALKKHLQDAAIVYTVDSELLNVAVVWLLIFDYYAEAITSYVQNGEGENPLVVTHKTGAQQVSVGYSIMNTATKQVQDCFKLLGIGPYSRSKIKEFLDQTKNKEDENDPFVRAAQG